jgi:L-alanine-DL-glutamate epimerase-like enolase superfamily enzyme
MKIARIDVFQKSYSLVEKVYAWSGGHYINTLDSTIVKITSDDGVNGYGECCPLGPAYMDAYAAGIPAGIRELGPSLLGQDPSQIGALNTLMDSTMFGHNYVKSAIDIACWDLWGKATGQPICTLMGARYVDDFPIYRAVSQAAPDEMARKTVGYREEGYRRFQLKVGSTTENDIAMVKAVLGVTQPGDIVVADANTGWNLHQATRVVNALAGHSVYIEQPCPTLAECLSIRRRTSLPMVLDEVITGIGPFLQAYGQAAMDVVNVKISRVGGLSKARQIRDLAQALGVAMTIEDSNGGDITTAAISQLVASTRPEFLFTTTVFTEWYNERISPDVPKIERGRVSVPDGPGLGITVDEKELGPPLFSLG